MDELIINAKMDVQGFVAGTKRLESAIKSFGSSVDRSMKTVQGAGKSILSTIMKWGPALLGVGGAYSIISKSVNAFMSQNQQLQGTLTSCWTAIGNMLGPIITSIVNMIATVVSYLVTFLNLLGLTSKTASQAGQKASGAAQQLKKQLMGFDELSVMQDNQGGGGGSGGGLKDIEPSDWMKKLADLLKNKMWDEAADMVIARLNDLIQTFSDKAEEWGKIAGEWIQGITHFIARILDETNWKELGVGLAKLLNGMLAEVEGINFGEDLGKIIAAKFTIAFKIVSGFLETFKFDRLGYIFSEMIKSIFDSMSRAIAEANPTLIGQNIAKFFNNIDWNGIADSIAKFLKSAWTFATTAFVSFLDAVQWRKIGEGIRTFFTNLWDDREEIVNTIFEVLESAWNAVKELLWGMFSEDGEEPPVVTALEKLEEMFGAVADAVARFAIVLKDAGIPKLLEGIAETIYGVFLGVVEDVTDAFQDLAYIFSSLDQLINGEISFGEFLKNIGEVVTGVNDVKRTVEESSDSAMNLISQYAEWAANSVAIWDDMAQASTNIVGMKRGIDEYTNSLTKNLDGEERAAVAVNKLKGEMNDLAIKYEGLIEECNNTTEAQQISAQMQEELASLTSNYINLLLEQGYSLDEIAAALGRSTDEIAKQAGVQGELATQVGQAAQETTELVKENERMSTASQHSASSLESVGAASDVAGQKLENLGKKSEEFSTKGAESAEKFGEEFTTTMGEKSTEMEAATTEAGNKAGAGLETGLKETDPAMLADEFVDSFNTELSSKTPEIEAATQQMAKTAVSAAQAEIQSGTDAISQIIQLSVNSIVQTIQMCGTQINQSVQASTNYVVESFSMVQRSVTTSMTAVNNLVTQVFQNMVELSSRAGIAVANNYTAGMTQLYTSATNVAVQLNNTFGSYFGQIAQNGYVWGKDLGILFNNGLVDACNVYLMPTLQQVAQSIKNVIGFSKPKEGPLSDADTYMPDFMQLLTKGVKDNMDKPLDAVQDLADGVRDELENGDYKFGDFEANQLDVAFAGFADQFLNGFGSMIDRLESIADKVIYEMPDVAAGNVVPYSVSQELSQNMGASPASLEDVVSAIDALRALMTQNNGENAGFNITVLLDGEQIESAVTTRQRRKRIAQGA